MKREPSSRKSARAAVIGAAWLCLRMTTGTPPRDAVRSGFTTYVKYGGFARTEQEGFNDDQPHVVVGRRLGGALRIRADRLPESVPIELPGVDVSTAAGTPSSAPIRRVPNRLWTAISSSSSPSRAQMLERSMVWSNASPMRTASLEALILERGRGGSRPRAHRKRNRSFRMPGRLHRAPNLPAFGWPFAVVIASLACACTKLDTSGADVCQSHADCNSGRCATTIAASTSKSRRDAQPTNPLRTPLQARAVRPID